jgi:integrase
VDERPATLWDEEQARLFFAQAQRSSLHYCLYLLIARTGARPGEALALKWLAVNLALGEITLRENLYRLGKRQIWGVTKTHQQDVVPIPPVLVEKLRCHREEQRRQKALLADEEQHRRQRAQTMRFHREPPQRARVSWTLSNTDLLLSGNAPTG